MSSFLSCNAHRISRITERNQEMNSASNKQKQLLQCQLSVSWLYILLLLLIIIIIIKY